MPKYVIEREIKEIGKSSTAELVKISKISCGVLEKMGQHIQWIHSYVTGDKIYCIYIAPDEETIREHAKRTGFPANMISEVKAIIDPTTSES